MNFFIDTYAEQFQRYLVVAKGMVERLKTSHDRKICVHWIRRLVDLTPCSLLVVTYRNQFLEYLIRVMQEAVMEEMLKDDMHHLRHIFQPEAVEGLEQVHDPRWLNKELDLPEIQGSQSQPTAPYFAHWSQDQKTYTATKALPGKGMLVYMAVSTDPSQGWSNLAE